MILINETTLFVVLMVTSLFGFVSLASIRMELRKHHRQACQLLFFVALAAVGGATMLCLTCRHEGWVLSAVMLGTMVVGGTFDAGSRRIPGSLAGSEWLPRG